MAQGWYGPSRPLRVGDGIRARSKRGMIGERWWSRRLTDVLESFGMSGRVAWGRSYVRSGQVISFEIRLVRDRPGPGVAPLAVPGANPPQWRRLLLIPRPSDNTNCRRIAMTQRLKQNTA